MTHLNHLEVTHETDSATTCLGAELMKGQMGKPFPGLFDPKVCRNACKCV